MLLGLSGLGAEPQPLGELPGTVRATVNSIAFRSDGRTFAIPVDSRGTVGLFRIKPERKAAVLTEAESNRIATLVSELDADEFATREEATRELAGFGARIEPQLKAARKATSSPEVRVRLGRVLAGIAEDEADRFEELGRIEGRGAGRFLIVRSLEFSPDESLLLEAGSDRGLAGARGHIRLLDAGTHKVLRQELVDGEVQDAKFSPDGRRIYAALDDEVGVWDTATLKRQATLPAHSGEIYSLAVSPDGRWLACAGVPQTVSIWDLEASRQVRLLEGFGDSVGHLDFSPDGRHLACASEDGTLTVWDMTTGKRLHSLRGHGGVEVWSVTYSPDGRTIATGDESGGAVLWDAGSGDVLARLGGRAAHGCHSEFSPNGRYLLTAAGYGKVQLWKWPMQDD